MKYTKQKK